MQDRVNEVRWRLASYLTENQTMLGDKLSRAEYEANRQTKDRYQQHVAKARRKAEEVIARLAQPPG
jgi:hypothetical protein